jgi:hypothetical protein
MMSNFQFDGNSKAGVAGGLLCTIAATVHSNELIKTMILAATGAIVSFGISLLLKMLVKKLKG